MNQFAQKQFIEMQYHIIEFPILIHILKLIWILDYLIDIQQTIIVFPKNLFLFYIESKIIEIYYITYLEYIISIYH